LNGSKDPGSSIIRNIRSYLAAGIWAGAMVGLVMGLLASVWYTRVSFLFDVVNELVLTMVYRHVSQELSATMAIPFTFFAVHFLAGVGGGAVAGLLLGALSGVLRFLKRRMVSWCVALVLLTFSFLYLFLWVLHAKLESATYTTGLPVALAGAIVVAALGFAVSALSGIVVDRLGRLGSRIAGLSRLAAIACAAVVAVALLVGFARHYGRNQPAAARHSVARYKVMLIGVDAASWAFVNPLIDEGVLPNIERLVDEGISGPLRTSLPPIESPTIWTSIATGKRRDKHGIHGFIQRSTESGQMVPVTSDMRKAAAFWEIASANALEVDVVSWYVSWPAQSVNGVFVSDRLIYPDVEQIVVPELWTEALRVYNDRYLVTRDERLARFAAPVYDPDYRELDPDSREYFWGEHLYILDGTHHKDVVVFNTARDLLRRGQPDIFAVYFEGIDRTFHRFAVHEVARRHPRVMRWFYPGIDDQELETFRNVIREYYIQVDEWIGTLLEEVDDYTAVIVVSDHGFGLRKMWKVHLALDPMLEFLGGLSYEEQDGHERIDWSKTQMYDSQRLTKQLGRVSLNLEGREENGIVPPDDVSALLHETRKKLESLRTAGGEKVFRSVGLESGAGTAKASGDIRVTLNEACLGDSLLYEGRALPVSAFTRAEWMPGNHRIDGIFIGKGGPFKRGVKIGGAGINDIAPTLLKLVGIPPSRDMDGRSLDRAFERSLRGEMVRGLVPNYERRTSEEPDTVRSTAADSLILRQLRTLGYIE
jgi:predicted AlkP superfamily phosphohydrolase/phosphomutase